MVEKNQLESQLRKERFEFVLTINGNIVCQRYFRINGFRKESFCSTQIVDTLRECVRLIKDDLRDKTDIYLRDTSPQVFPNKEYMLNWAENPTFKLEVPSFIVLEDSDECFVWNGTGVEPYANTISKYDYVGKNNEEQPCVLKFALLEYGREICSEVFDGNVYPRFVRTNIDLSNSKNKYMNDDNFSIYDATIVSHFIENRQDLIPIIVNKFCTCCSDPDADTHTDYDTTERYYYSENEKDGYKLYNHNIYRTYGKMVHDVELKCKKKTDKYFKSIEM